MHHGQKPRPETTVNSHPTDYNSDRACSIPASPLHNTGIDRARASTSRGHDCLLLRLHILDTTKTVYEQNKNAPINSNIIAPMVCRQRHESMLSPTPAPQQISLLPRPLLPGIVVAPNPRLQRLAAAKHLQKSGTRGGSIPRSASAKTADARSHHPITATKQRAHHASQSLIQGQSTRPHPTTKSRGCHRQVARHAKTCFLL